MPKILRAAGIPEAEIRRIKVVSERGTVAERLEPGEIRVERPELLRKLARAERRTAGVPVWSSHAVIGFTQKGTIGQLEIHWPNLAPEVLAEAKVLASLVRKGFKPAELRGAEVESVEAGVIHSPAIGFFMDVVPVVRVSTVRARPGSGRSPSSTSTALASPSRCPGASSPQPRSKATGSGSNHQRNRGTSDADALARELDEAAECVREGMCSAPASQ